MRGWFHAADIQLLQLFHEAKNVAELRAELLFLFRRKLDAREMRYVFDVKITFSHDGENRVPGGKFQVPNPFAARKGSLTPRTRRAQSFGQWERNPRMTTSSLCDRSALA